MPRHSADALTRLLAERIVVLDGATGTQVQELRLDERRLPRRRASPTGRST